MENETAKILKDLKDILEVEDLFPWQEKLLQKFIDSDLPSSVDLPTGLGKTSIMAIWLVSRCFNPNLPRRFGLRRRSACRCGSGHRGSPATPKNGRWKS